MWRKLDSNSTISMRPIANVALKKSDGNVHFPMNSTINSETSIRKET